MFYDKFKQLCDAKGVSCNKAALEIGLSNATPTKWKKTGATPDSTTLAKVSKYFAVPIAYLLGETDDPFDRTKTHWAEVIYENEKMPTSTAGEQIPFADRREALASAGIHIYLDADAKLTEDQLDDILDFIEFQQRKNGR